MRQAILVTGGAGYIGSHVCKALASAGYLPVTYDSLVHGRRAAVRWGPFEEGDLADPGRLDAAIARHKPLAVMHFAAFIEAGESVLNPAKYYENNVVAILNLLAALRRAKIERIVFSSSAAVYGAPMRTPIDEDHPLAPINAYGASKLMCERILQDYADAYGLRAVSLRYFNAAGADPEGEIGETHDPETHLIPIVLEAAAGRRPFVSVYGDRYDTRDGTCVRDYVHVCDLADAHVLALRRLEYASGCRVYNLGQGRGFTVREVIETARRVTGRPIDVRVHGPRAGDPPVLLADAQRASNELVWRPVRGALEVQLADAWKWTQSRVGARGRGACQHFHGTGGAMPAPGA